MLIVFLANVIIMLILVTVNQENVNAKIIQMDMNVRFVLVDSMAMLWQVMNLNLTLMTRAV